MLRVLLLWLFFLCLDFTSTLARNAPFAMRISCGARQDVLTKPTNIVWHKDYAYTGGVPDNATLPSYISPPLKTLRYFPLSEGPQNCYNFNRVPKGHYLVRIFFALLAHPRIDNEPLFDISVEGTQIYSLKPGWTNQDDQVFAEAILFLTDGTASLCFHSSGHGDPATLAIEILQIDDKAYYLGSQRGHDIMLRTAKRVSCGTGKSKSDVDLNGDHWGGDRFWHALGTFGQNSDEPRSTKSAIKQASAAPNFYPEDLYKSALVGTDNATELTYILDVDPNKNYSVWFHFAEIIGSVTGVGDRVFNILINGHTVFEYVDIIKLSGGHYTALVLNTTVAVSGRALIISLRPKGGSYAIINAIEVFEIIHAESKTLPSEVRALQNLKKALGLPQRLGWNGDPCVPQQHPWRGADCQLDAKSGKWVVDGLGLDNQGLRGSLPNEISRLRHLQNINLSGNNIHGVIPSSIGTITSLQVLDLSYNFLNGSIPEALGQLTSLRILNLNGNFLSGKVPAALGGRLLHRASFNFTDNGGLCGIPGLSTCGRHLSGADKIGIGFGASFAFLLLLTCSWCCWKRRQNILRVQQITARNAPYAKSRTQLSRDIQMTMHQNHGLARSASETGPILHS